MRTRDKPPEAYGLTRKDLRKIYATCKDDAWEGVLWESVNISVPEGIREAVHVGLSHGLGYTGTERIVPVYCGRKDFYGYKRKTAATFYNLMRLLGLWKYNN